MTPHQTQLHFRITLRENTKVCWLFEVNSRAYVVTIINLLQQLLQRGVKAGVFRRGLDPIDLHMSISALCFYNVSNRHTFSRIFERDMNSPKAVAARRAIITDTILRWCSIQQPV